MRLAQGFVSYTRATVFGLFFAGSPFAIARLIVAIVVDSFQRQSFWPAAHVGDEIVKVFSPAIADRYTSSAISLICECPRPVAAVEHGTPYHIFRPPSSIPCGSMPQASSPRKGIFPLETAAGPRQASEKALLQDDLFFAALTTAEPPGPFLSGNQSQHREASECLAS